MPCGSALYLEPGGTIDPGGGGGSSNLISICSTNYWTAGEGPITGPQCFNCVLPIRLITFNATCTGNNIVLNWATATETNNHYFTIERSDDGYSWIEMGTINGAGTTSGPHYYTWTDADPLPGISYYQLKQTDYDGQSSYAGVIASSCNGTGVLNLYPNPGQGNIYCRIRSNNAQTVSFKIIDELGRNIVSYADNVAKGVTDEPLPTAKLQAGVYLLVIEFSDGTSSVHKSFIISR